MKACCYCKFHKGDGFPYGDIECIKDGKSHYKHYSCDDFVKYIPIEEHNQKIITEINNYIKQFDCRGEKNKCDAKPWPDDMWCDNHWICKILWENI